MSRALTGAASALALATALIVPAAAPAATRTIHAGPLAVTVQDAPLRVTAVQSGRTVLRTAAPGAADGVGPFGFTTAAGRRHAVRGRSLAGDARTITMTLATDDPSGRVLGLRVQREADGRVLIDVQAHIGDGAPVTHIGAAFDRAAGERALGFGERSDAVARTAGTVENVVSEGPYASPTEYGLVQNTVPPWGLRRSNDATYFPMPWLVSTQGFGLLVDDPRASRFRLGDPWSLELDGTDHLRLQLFGGPAPADVVRRLTQFTGRQPAPSAPWVLGPWFQTGHGNVAPEEQTYVDTLQAADAPASAVETHMRYMPCRANLDYPGVQAQRTAAFRAKGLTPLAYVNAEVCNDLPIARQMADAGGLQRTPGGDTYVFTGYVGGRGATPIAQVDFTSKPGTAIWQSVLDQIAADGNDGFMEDYGEYTPLDSVSSDGTRGDVMHNLYPVQYHRAGQQWAARQKRPVTRWIRSGWTGVQPYAQIVWGGDPTTGWGFDGLRSVLTETLTMGLSGVSMWATDIGGFFTLGDQRLTPELLARWIEVGSTLGVMRTKAEGIGLQPLAERPQIWQQPTLPIWRRYAKLRTQLYPYLAAAQAEYRRTGMPLTRHLLLGYPRDPRAATTDDEYLFGPSLLAAPVLTPGATTRQAYLPAGSWVDLGRTLRYRTGDGGFDLGPARVIGGGRTVTASAPLDVLPLYAKAGALLPMLPPDVDTLSSYGSGKGMVHYAERRDQLRVLGVPRGTSTAAYDAGRMTSTEGRGTWTFTLRGASRTVRAQISLATLRTPFVPRTVTGVRSWSYDRATRTLRFTARGGAITVRAAR